MELFVVKNQENKVLAAFDNKPEAKEFRDSGKGLRVSRGNDNLPSPRGYPAKMRRQPK